jgi:hypothetical protein
MAPDLHRGRSGRHVNLPSAHSPGSPNSTEPGENDVPRQAPLLFPA